MRAYWRSEKPAARGSRRTCKARTLGLKCPMAWQQLIPIIGVAALVVLAWRLGTLKTARLQDEEGARARFAEDFPDLRPKHVILGTDGQTALLVFKGDRLGAVFGVGGRFATRLFHTGDLEYSTSKGAEIYLKTRDITIPYLNVKGVSRDDKDTLSHSSVITEAAL